MATVSATPTASELLHATCTQALKEEHKIQLQLEALQLKLKKLRCHRRNLDIKASDSQAATEDALLAYAKDDCLNFCTKIYQKFPREIRDVIYGYITGCEDITISELSPPSGSRKAPRMSYFDSSCETQLRHQSRDLDPDYWWLPDFVGADMVRELGENYYRTCCFHFENDLEVIPKFRITDQWKLGFFPVSFVTNIEVGIRCDGHVFKTYKVIRRFTEQDQGGNWGDTCHTCWHQPLSDPVGEFMDISRPELLIQLESLFGFRIGTALTIKIHMSRDGKFYDFEGLEFMNENLVPVIFPTLQRLKYAGFKVHFTLANNGVCTWGPGILRKFTSAWNPVSTEEITKSFLEYVDTEQSKDKDAELFDSEDETFSGEE